MMAGFGTPVSPLPIVGPRAHLPSNTLTAHLADVADPHNVRSLVPVLRTGSGTPTVEPNDKATDFYFDSTNSSLYVMKEVSGTRSWVAVASGGGGGSTPPGAMTLAQQIAALSHSDLTEFEKDTLIQKLADYVVAKESLS